VFATVSPQPLAAASVAQVHTATLASGEEVVLKIQRAGIEPVVERDLDIVGRLARTLASTTSWGRTIGVRELAGGFATALREELDFRVEAANMAAVAATARDVVIPVPHRELCTRRLLVMQRLDGVPLAAAGPEIVARGLDPYALARTLLDTLLRQVVLDGVFHADPHPGNVLLLSDGRLALLDFGSVGRLDVAVRAALQQLLLAVDRGDPVAVSDALLEVVPRPDEIDAAALERAVGVVLARHLGPGGTGSAGEGMRMFADLVRIVAGFGLAVPPAVAAVFRALATGEGTLTALAPGFDVVAEARRFATERLSDRVAAAAGHRRAGHAAADAAADAAPGGPDPGRDRGRPAGADRAAVRRRARPPVRHRAAAAAAADRARRDRGADGGAAARHLRRPGGDRAAGALPAIRLLSVSD
jgi:ubiquinone biosynthesis protein